MSKSNITFITIQNKSVLVHVFFVLLIVCLYICVCEWLLQNNNHQTKHENNTLLIQHSWVRGPLRECRSIRSGASGFPYYCTPLVCISVVIGSLTVWRHNKPKTKKPQSTIKMQIHHFKTTCMSPRSIAGVLFDSVEILRKNFVLCTTCMTGSNNFLVMNNSREGWFFIKYIFYHCNFCMFLILLFEIYSFI